MRIPMTRSAVLLGTLAFGLALVAAPPPAPADAIILKKADFGVATQTRTKRSMWWSDEVGKRSGGKVKIQYFPAGSLLKARDTFEGIRSGAVDIGIWVQAYTPSISPMSGLYYLPGISTHIGPAMRAVTELVFGPEFSYYRDEMRKHGVEPLYAWGVSDQELISTKPIGGLAALKGLKVRAIGRAWPKLISEYGGVPLTMPWPEVYEGLSRGTLEANVGYVTANVSAKLHEVAKHHTRIHLGAPAGPMAIMNKAKYDALPADVKKIMAEVSAEYVDLLAADYAKDLDAAMSTMKAGGVTFYEWPAADRAKLEGSMRKMWKAWADGMDAKGLPGNDALKRYQELQKKHAG